jgi:hypothetical protein
MGVRGGSAAAAACTAVRGGGAWPLACLVELSSLLTVKTLAGMATDVSTPGRSA